MGPWYAQSTNYARDDYARYLSRLLEGEEAYDTFGNPLGRGWLVYSWMQEQPGPRGERGRPRTDRDARHGRDEYGRRLPRSGQRAGRLDRTRERRGPPRCAPHPRRAHHRLRRRVTHHPRLRGRPPGGSRERGRGAWPDLLRPRHPADAHRRPVPARAARRRSPAGTAPPATAAPGSSCSAERCASQGRHPWSVASAPADPAAQPSAPP